MGCVKTVGATTFPKQGSMLGTRVRILFHYDTKAMTESTCVRDDMEAPWVVIFKLDDGRHVLSTECQYQPVY